MLTRHIVLLFIPRLIQCQFTLQTDYFQTNFFDSFDFFSGADPTNGFVEYTGRNDELISSTTNNAKIRVSTEQSTPNGRPSIRITSKESYETGLIILDLEHMPGGICGTWPAFWTVGPSWPTDGEIDIIEGVNDVQTNQATLHTGSTCSISASSMSGNILTDNCDVSNGENTGCGIATSDQASYGSDFNNNGGGVYATLLTQSNVIVWFWTRDAIPQDVLGDSPDPSGWSTPFANFSGPCDFDTAFTAQQLVFDTTFCGDWAGDTWSSSSCASKAATCEDYVANHGDDFSEAYWSIAGLKVYQSAGSPSPSAPPSSTQSEVAASASILTSSSPSNNPITSAPPTTQPSVVPTPSTPPPPPPPSTAPSTALSTTPSSPPPPPPSTAPSPPPPPPTTSNPWSPTPTWVTSVIPHDHPHFPPGRWGPPGHYGPPGH